MPNTKSAERRMRNSERKNARNRTVKSRLKTLETKYRTLVDAGKKDEATVALRLVASAFDKATKGSAVHASTSARTKSRLTLALNKLK